MSFPNFPNKYQGEAVMQPQHILEISKRFGRLPRIEPPESLILCMRIGLPERLHRRIPIQRVGHLLGDFFMVRRSQGRLGVLSNFGIGAPVIASLAEELIAFGVRRFVLLSWGGALQPDIQMGSLVLCEQAIRDEGVSHHYLPAQKFVPSDRTLTLQLKESITRRGATCRLGATWTTDAPYRETVEEVKQYQAEGVQTVEMETAALFALGQARRVQTASIVIPSDSLAQLRWEAPADLLRIDQAFETAYLAAVEALS